MTQEWFGEISDPGNRLLSALIAIPALAPLFSPNSFGNAAIFPRPTEPELRPEQPDSPVITTRQEIVSGKKGVLHRTSRDARVVERKLSDTKAKAAEVEVQLVFFAERLFLVSVSRFLGRFLLRLL